MIPRLQALGPRQDPNLQEMHPLAPLLILLRMRDPRPCRRELHIAPLEAVEQLLVLALPFAAERGVAVRQLATEDVAEDLEVAVWVRGESCPGRDAVFIQNANGAEVLEARAVVVREVEAAVGDEPALVEVGAA
jgi:hypothetical protein